MAATTYEEAAALMADANCDICYAAPGQIWYEILAALIHVGNSETVPDAQTLASEIGCLECVISPGMLPYAILQAIRDISGGGGGTGSAGIVGTGSPEGVVAAPPGTSYYDNTTPGSVHVWVKMTGVGNTGWEQTL